MKYIKLNILLFIASFLLFSCAHRENAAPIENVTAIPNFLKQDVGLTVDSKVVGSSSVTNKTTVNEEPQLGSLDDRNKSEQTGKPQLQNKNSSKIANVSKGSGTFNKPAGSTMNSSKFVGVQNSEWIFPTQGKSLQKFIEANKGIDITGVEGQAIYSSNNGNVVYSGNGLKGYGNLIIIKHNNTYLSAYAHNKVNLVKAGESVSRGQKIAEMGINDNKPILHFEIRQNGKPVDPLLMIKSFSSKL